MEFEIHIEDKPETRYKNETDLMNHIQAALSKLGGVCVRRNVGKFRQLSGNRVVTCGLPGESDLEYFAPGGKTFFFEVKTRTGKVSDKQKRFIEHMRGLGFTAYVVRSVEEALHIAKGG